MQLSDICQGFQSGYYRNAWRGRERERERERGGEGERERECVCFQNIPNIVGKLTPIIVFVGGPYNVVHVPICGPQ